MTRYFKAAIRALAVILALQPVLVSAQQFPLTMPANTVYGRLGMDTGPGQAITFSTLLANLLATQQVSQQTFGTLAAAAATKIPSSVAVVTTLSRNAAGDFGGASYTRIAPTTPAAWRFRSADGQWWAIYNRTVTPEMFGCVSGGGFDNTGCFQSLAAWINGFGQGSTVNLRQGASYKIWPAGTTPAPLMLLQSSNGLTFNFNGAKFTTDNPFSPQGNPKVFLLQNAAGLIVNNPAYVQTAFTTLTDTQGAYFFSFEDQAAPFSSGIKITNLNQTGGICGLCVGVASLTAVTTSGISLINANFNSVYYGLGFQNAGDNFFGRGISCNNTGRCYFPYGVSDQDVEIIGNGGGPFNQNLLKVYAQPTAPIERNTLSNIRLVYKNAGRVNATASASLVALDFAQVVAQVNVSGAADNGAGKTRLTVDTTANMLTGQTWFFNGATGTTAINGTHSINVVSPTTLDLLDVTYVANSPGGYARVPATIKNVKVLLDVNDTTGNGQPSALLTYKHNSDGTVDTTTSGYTLENVEVGGTLKGYGGGTVAIDLFNNDAVAIGTWTNENIRNIFLRDLTIPTGFALINATNIQGNLVFENIYGPASTWTVTGSGTNTRYQNVSGTSGLTDHLTVIPSTAPTHQFATSISNQGVIGYAQPSFSDLLGTFNCSALPALTGDVTTIAGACPTTLATAQPAVHTWALAQTFTVAPVFTDQSGSRTALGLGTMATVSSTAGGDLSGTFPNPTINNAPVIAKVLTGFVSGAGTVSAADSILAALQKIDGNVALKAPLASPAMTGTPTAPTAAVDTNTTQIATTAMVLGQAASATPLIDGSAAVGTSTRFARGDHVHPTDTTRAPLASPTFTGVPAAPTAAVDTNTTQLATTAMVLGQAASATPLIDGTAAVGTSTRYARGDHVHPRDTTKVATVKKQIFTASGTYTPSTGMLYAIIECVGSGGSGAGGTGPATGFYVGGGGGSGSYSRAVVSAATVGGSQTVTVGAGGTAPAAGNTNGASGSDVSVGALCIGKGGGGGNFASGAQVGAAGVGGVAGTGDLTIAGNAGQSGMFTTVASVLFASGAGASSYFGGGAPAASQSGGGTTTAGNAASNYGGGGGGGNAVSTTSTFAGGNGSNGAAFITEFCSQ